MEGLNKMTLSFPLGKVLKALTILGLVLSTAACGDKGGSAAPVTPIIVDPSGCVSCVGVVNPVILTTFEAASGYGATSSVRLSNMQIFGQGSLVVPNASGANYNNYVGPIAMQGLLTVTTNQVDSYYGAVASSCVIPAGTYNVQTYAVGSMGYAGGDVNMPALITTNGAIELKIEGGQLNGYGKRLLAKVSVTKVNGVVCSANFYNMFN